MYYLCVGAFAVSVVVLLNLRRSRFGRLLIAVRENEANVQSFGVGLVRTKLAAFVISGAMCGVAGAFFAVQLRAVTGQGFGASQSFTIFVYAIIGGVTSIVGVLLGVAYFNIAGYTLQHNVVFGFIWETIPLALIYIEPGGLIRILTGWRDAVLRVIAQRRQLVVPSLFADYDAEAASRQLIPMGEPITGTGLAALGGAKRYALDSALHAKPGMDRV
jgi:branched-chain amino acid transport system permease protein